MINCGQQRLFCIILKLIGDYLGNYCYFKHVYCGIFLLYGLLVVDEESAVDDQYPVPECFQ